LGLDREGADAAIKPIGHSSFGNWYYIARQDHTSASGDEPLSGSSKWAEKSFDSWTSTLKYLTGEYVYYEEDGRHYQAQSDHEPAPSDEPLSGSSNWAEVQLEGTGENYEASAQHISADGGLPLSESDNWAQVEVTEYYNKWEERSAIGKLDGLYDYVGDVYGVAGGRQEDTWFAVDEERGFRLMNQDTKLGQWGTGGTVRAGPYQDSCGAHAFRARRATSPRTATSGCPVGRRLLGARKLARGLPGKGPPE
jgi:hypothetical protein